jgi:hypothetical protein
MLVAREEEVAALNTEVLTPPVHFEAANDLIASSSSGALEFSF